MILHEGHNLVLIILGAYVNKSWNSKIYMCRPLHRICGMGSHVIDSVDALILACRFPQNGRHSLCAYELQELPCVVDLLCTQQLRLHVPRMLQHSAEHFR